MAKGEYIDKSIIKAMFDYLKEAVDDDSIKSEHITLDRENRKLIVDYSSLRFDINGKES